MRSWSRLFSFVSWPIRVHLLLLVLLTSLPFLAVLIVASNQQRDNTLVNLGNETKSLVANVVAQHESIVAGAQQLLNTLAQVPIVQQQEIPQLNRLFASLIKENSQYANILLADPAGNVLASARPFQPPLSIADRKFFRDVLASHRFSPGEYVIGKTANKPLFNFGAPAFAPDGQLQAILAVGIDLDYINKTFSHFTLPPGSNLGITDHRGIVVHRIQEPEKYTGKPASPVNFKIMQEGPAAGNFSSTGLDGVRRHYSYRKVSIDPSSPPYLYILAGVPEQYLQEISRTVTRNYVTLFGLLFLLALTMAHLLAKYAITGRVEELLAAINSLAAGHWEEKAGAKVRGGELGLLATAFDEMAANLRRKEQEQAQAAQEKHQLESRLRQSYKLEAVGTLAGGIAHDFNNILTPILGYSELIHDSLPAASPLREEIGEVVKAAYRARELVRQILTFSRQGEQASMPLQIHLIIKEALKLLRSSVPATIEFHEEIDPHSGLVLADPTQIHQVVMNLVTNAYHAMREHGGTLTVTLKPVSLPAGKSDPALPLPPGEYIQLTVGDTGSGIDPAIRERIFEPYFTTKKLGEGTGLGLSVTHGIIKNLGGLITVESEPGQGTTFQVYFPLLSSAEPGPEPGPAAPVESGGQERLLVVDDEPAIVNLLEKILTAQGYRVTVTSSSREALRMLTAAPQAFDLLLTDITMPELNGADLARRVREIRPELPVILCTGFSELLSAEESKRIGISHYVMKPVVPSDLTRAVRQALGKGQPPE